MISAKDSARILAPLLILGLAVAGFLYMQATKPVTAPKPAEERIWTVATVAAVPEDVQPEIKAFGQIFAGRQVELRPLVEGRVIETGPAFVEGGVVAAGELLIAIDPFDYENTRQERKAQVDEAKAKLTEIEAERSGARKLLARDKEQVVLRQRDVARRQGLVKRGATSQKALERFTSCPFRGTAADDRAPTQYRPACLPHQSAEGGDRQAWGAAAPSCP